MCSENVICARCLDTCLIFRLMIFRRIPPRGKRWYLKRSSSSNCNDSEPWFVLVMIYNPDDRQASNKSRFHLHVKTITKGQSESLNLTAKNVFHIQTGLEILEPMVNLIAQLILFFPNLRDFLSSVENKRWCLAECTQKNRQNKTIKYHKSQMITISVHISR